MSERTRGRVTLAHVATHAEVSPMTVSRVVNGSRGVGEATRKRVQESIDALGYRPDFAARGLKRSRSGAVGLLVPDITNPYFPQIVRGAEDLAFEVDYNVFLNNVLEDTKRESRALQALEDRRVDGVVVCSPRLPDRLLHPLLRRHAAAVVVNRWAPSDVAGSVRVEHQVGATLAVEHLVGLGRRKIGFLAGPKQSFAGRERLEGLQSAATKCGLDLQAKQITFCAPTVEGGRRGANSLLKSFSSLDALFCFNDVVAAGALLELRDNGRKVPDDVAVVGYDDIKFAEMFTPALTTLSVPTYDLGKHAMRVLLDRMEGRHEQVGISVQPKLVIRASTIGVGKGKE